MEVYTSIYKLPLSKVYLLILSISNNQLCQPNDDEHQQLLEYGCLWLRSAAITFVIAFVMRIPQGQTIAFSALAAIIVFSGLMFRSYGRDKTKTNFNDRS